MTQNDTMDFTQYLEKNRETSEELRKENTKLAELQYELFRKKLQDLGPVIKYIRENGIYFSHPNTKLLTIRGPIILCAGNEQYVYSLQEGKVLEFNDFSSNPTRDISAYSFISDYNFEEVMKSLDHIIKIPELYTENLRNIIKKRKNWINQFS